jgi:hypothetical protein
MIAATEEEIDACQFWKWYPILQKNSIRSVILDLDEEFIAYLKEDGVVLPESVDTCFNVDHLSDDEEQVEIKEDEESIRRRRGFPIIEQQLKHALAQFDNEVFVKLNWSAPKDAVWVNNGSLKCMNLHDIFVLLKSSDRVTYDLEKTYESCPSSLKTSPTEVKLIVRKWANLIPSMEFRGFIRNHIMIGKAMQQLFEF